LTIDGLAKTVEIAAVEAMAFISLQAIRTLNIAGPRESSHPGAGAYATELVGALLRRIAGEKKEDRNAGYRRLDSPRQIRQ
jgi:hypothetical protein